MNKRGASHVEMVFSFILFVAAIGFALYFFRPTDSSRLVETSFDYLFREIEKNASTEVFIFSAKINHSANPPSNIGFNVSGSNFEYKSSVFSENGVKLNSTKYGDEIVFADSPSGWNGIDFVSIVLSDEFEDELTPGDYNESYYEISSSLKKDILSEKKFLSLNQNYNENYSMLKEEFNIPGRVNFGFSVSFSDGSKIEAKKEIPASLEVFVEKRRIEILRTNSGIEFGELEVRVW